MMANQTKNMKKVMKIVANNNNTHLQLSKSQLSRKLQKKLFSLDCYTALLAV